MSWTFLSWREPLSSPRLFSSSTPRWRDRLHTHISLDANQKFTATAPAAWRRQKCIGGRRACSGIFSICIFKGGSLAEACVKVPRSVITAHRLCHASATLRRMRGAFPHLIIHSNSFISGVIPSHSPRCISLPPASAAQMHYPPRSDPAVMQPSLTSPELINVCISLLTLSWWILFSCCGGKAGDGRAL